MIGKAMVGTGIAAGSIGLGVALGSYAGQTEGNAQTGALAGAGTGLAVGTAGIVASQNLGGIAKGVGKGVIGLGKGAYGFVTNPAVHQAALQGAQAIGGGVLAAGLGTAKAVGSVAPVMALKAGAKYGSIASGVFRVNPAFKEGTSGQMLKFTKRGAALFGAGVVGKMAWDGFKAVNDSKVGASDGQITSATPNPPIYSSQMRNAGATGDLAFAMHAQRNG